jgi:hypothetical protein
MNETDIKAVSLPIPNMDKLYAVLDQIEADPEHWNQVQWSEATECGTTMCFAGWACKMEGLKLQAETDSSRLARAYLANGEFIEYVAQEILGLADDEAYSLFTETTYDPDGDSLSNDDENHRAQMLNNVKVEVAKIAARAKEQHAAFERVARELIESVPELEDVLKPGYLCPESRELVMKYLGGRDGGN